MDGILIVNKPKGYTSRDVVNIISNIYKVKKVGHTGTLDPIATGVLVVCIGKATKLVEMLTSDDKEYIATVKVGLLTDTLDMDGKIIEENKCLINDKLLNETLKSFIGTYNQEVPAYSAVKVNGKKLYEYARSGEKIDLPKRSVDIKSIELLESSTDYYKFKVSVSKGTYIRSLIRDINKKMGIIGVMSDLVRTRQGNYFINDSVNIDEIKKGNVNVITLEDALKNNVCVNIDNKMYTKIINGQIIDNVYNNDMVVFLYNNKVVAIYKTYEKNKCMMKPYKMFIS